MWRMLTVVLTLTSVSGAQRFPVEMIASGPTPLYPSSFLQDDQGMLWVGTQQGLFRYDGRSLVNYGPKLGLPQNEAGIHPGRNRESVG